MKKKCADCGADVEARHTTASGETMWGRKVGPTTWDFCCRWEPGAEPGTLASADYHYVEGEEQRRFRAP